MTGLAQATAQAKVNLGLRILRRESDGFHSLETVFHQLELHDDVTVERTPRERVIICRGPAVPADGLGPASQNLAWRAADAYARAVGWTGGFAIDLTKRIPPGGGLGGGSSDAGAVLRACEALSETPLGPERIQEIAASLGSDVPFLTGTAAAALGTGRGELLQPVPPLPQRSVALIFPRFGISTKDAYSWLAASRTGYRVRPGLIRFADTGDWRRIASSAVNDFEPVVGARHPEIPACIEALRAAGAFLAMLSGSGSTVFGVFDTDDDSHAREALGTLPGDPAVVWTRTAQRVVPVVRSG